MFFGIIIVVVVIDYCSVELGLRDLPFKKNIIPVLVVASLGHAMVGFVNGKYVGTVHGKHVEKSFVFEKPIELQAGVNNITLLAMTVGFPVSSSSSSSTLQLYIFVNSMVHI